MTLHLRPPPQETPAGTFPLPCTADELAQAAQRLTELRARALDADEPIIVSKPAPE